MSDFLEKLDSQNFTTTSDIRIKEEPNDSEYITYMQEYNFNHEWPEIVKSEGIKEETIMCDLSNKARGSSEQVTVKMEKHPDNWNKASCSDELIEYKVTQIKYESDLKEYEHVNPEDTGEDFKSALSLSEDVSESPKSVHWYQCRFCEYQIKSKQQLVHHFKLKHDESAEWFQCPCCEYKTKDKCVMRKHTNWKHNEQIEWLQCQYCEYKTKYKNTLDRHTKMRHDNNVKWFQCQLCDHKTKYKHMLVLHFKMKHLEKTGSAEEFHCPFCGDGTNGKKRSSICKHHEEIEWNQCDHCEYKTKDKSTLKRHVKIKHNHDTEWLHCHICKFKTKHRSSLRSHIKINHENIEWNQCEFCEYKTKRKDHLKLHVKRMHKIKTE